MSELDKIIPPEIVNDEFYQVIRSLAENEDLKHVLEIGSSAGEGSTRAFVEGLSKNASNPNLYCLEVSKPRHEALAKTYQSFPFVKCYHASSVPLDSFPSPEEVRDFYYEQNTVLNQYPLSQVLGWRDQDIEYIERNLAPQNGIELIKQDNGIDYFDLVLIDGSEFTGVAELEAVYGARLILLDDINAYKNFENLTALKADPNYELIHENRAIRNGYAVFARKEGASFKKAPINDEVTKTDDKFSVHFFTIVLNGMPFIKHHLDVFKTLPFDWHWHIIEGVAELKHCTAWSVTSGGNIPTQFHREGRSNDGTEEYLNEIESQFPDNISIYRKSEGNFWQGKLEMVNAPLAYIDQECLLWQIDSDELWSAEQIQKMRELFLSDSSKQAAYVHCHYFIGPKKYISTLNAWATQPKDWLRVWRFKPGMKWDAHEPPILVNQEGHNIADIAHFSRDETKAAGLIYEHPSYVLEEQVKFKQDYYGYKDAVDLWKQLQEAKGDVDPADYLHWAAKNGAIAREWQAQDGELQFFKYLPKEEKKNVILASDLAKQTDQDLTQIATDSAFHKAIQRVFEKARPKKIVETGTYLGAGTTSIISATLRDLGITGAEFYSIEINPAHLQQAVINLGQRGFTDVRLIHGLSVPRSLLPSIKEIEDFTVNNIEFNNIIVDHSEIERAQNYFAETNFEGPEDMLQAVLNEFKFKPDFVLLDSAGYMGNVEFNYVVSQLKGECYIALDDVRHIKHRKSYLQMYADPRFKIIEESEEKFGFCIAHFTPDVIEGSVTVPNLDIKNIVWLRADAIGDNILSSSMLPYVQAQYPNAKIHVACQSRVASLYQNCPYVESVVPFDQSRAEVDQDYLAQVCSQLQELKADLLLNSVYSRSLVMEVIALNSGAKSIVGHIGDTSNITDDLLNQINPNYAHLCESPGEYKSELFRHQDFLRGLGVTASNLNPKIWTSLEDEVFAEDFYRVNKLDSDKTVVMFAGAQADFRCLENLGDALSSLVDEENLTVVAVGSQNEAQISLDNAHTFPHRFINTCGELTFTQSVAILKRARLAVGSETSLAHAAAAVSIPHVIVIGGGHFGRFMPYASTTSLVCLPLECFGCNWKCSKPQHYCLRDIDSSVIERALKDALVSNSEKARIYAQNGSKNSSLANYPKIADISELISGV
ncbi:MAG: hypothetical protein H6619_04015, partial [Deltaproteobacteria bacterium]|nr:hypothetical protein [Deltaproteobacteria bacterium]